MDSLTQIVLGASVGEAVLGKKVGNKAALWGAICGTIPDLDVLANPFVSELDALVSHRGVTHSLLFCIVMAPIMGQLIHRIHRQERAGPGNWAKLAFWALLTHPLLDCFTTWGFFFCTYVIDVSIELIESTPFSPSNARSSHCFPFLLILLLVVL
ncbi:MAG: metal-dependent hydrolase, partial [Bacteroidota bacterium]